MTSTFNVRIQEIVTQTLRRKGPKPVVLSQS